MLTIFLIALSFFCEIHSEDSFCLSPKIMSPCICDEDQRQINCDGPSVASHSMLQAPFEAMATHLNKQNWVVFSLLIRDTSILELPYGFTRGLKILSIWISGNRNLGKISQEAFSSTAKTTIQFYLRNSAIRTRMSNDEIFWLVTKFPNLESLSFVSNGIESIPDCAFREKFPSLTSLWIAEENLGSIGHLAFAGLINLKSLDINYNKSSNSGLYSDSFVGLSDSTTVGINYNSGSLKWLEEDAFKPLLNSVARFTVSTIKKNDMICDNKVNWICMNKTLYKPKLQFWWNADVSTYKCSTAPGGTDIWDYCTIMRIGT